MGLASEAMDLLTSDTAKSLFGSLNKMFDRAGYSEQEKAEHEMVVKQYIMELLKEKEQRQAELDQKKIDFMMAEAKQEDPYTKRLRPTVGYVGLAAIIWNHVLVPTAAMIIQAAKVQAASAIEVTKFSIDLPSEFWWAWGGVMSIYVVGRSAEKRGYSNRLISFITGSQPKK